MEERQSVLKRLRKKTLSLKETAFVEYEDPASIKRMLKTVLKGEKNDKKQEVLPRRAGRPKMDENLKSRDIRITLKPHLYALVEERKKMMVSRSKALNDLLDKGLRYEQLRGLQAESLKGLLKDFAKIFSTIKIEHPRAHWRKRRINFERNEESLSKLYRKSLEIKHYLASAHIDPVTFFEVGEFLNEREKKYLEFASIPERIARMVENTMERQ